MRWHAQSDSQQIVHNMSAVNGNHSTRPQKHTLIQSNHSNPLTCIVIFVTAPFDDNSTLIQKKKGTFEATSKNFEIGPL